MRLVRCPNWGTATFLRTTRTYDANKRYHQMHIHSNILLSKMLASGEKYMNYVHFLLTEKIKPFQIEQVRRVRFVLRHS